MSRTYTYFVESGLIEPCKWDEEYKREYEIWKHRTQQQLKSNDNEDK